MNAGRLQFRIIHLLAATLFVAVVSPILPAVGRLLVRCYRGMSAVETMKSSPAQRSFDDAIKEIEENSRGDEDYPDEVFIGYPPNWRDITGSD